MKRRFDLVASTVLAGCEHSGSDLDRTGHLGWRMVSVRRFFIVRSEPGRRGAVFNVYKFRSMNSSAEKDGKAIWASKADCRVTRVGAFLRKYRLDELPQVINIIKGDMSFVGTTTGKTGICRATRRSYSVLQGKTHIEAGSHRLGAIELFLRVLHR